MPLRIFTSFASLALHVGAAVFMFATAGGAALESGTGEDMFVVEQGLAVEGVARLGDADVTTEALEVEPQEASLAQQAVEEVKATEEVQDEVVSSEAGPQQDELPEAKPEPVEQPRPEQVATLEQAEQIKVEEKLAAGAEQRGGAASERSQYLGSIRSHLERKKVNPRSRHVGTVVVKFVVDARGNIVSHEIATSSGVKVLDEAAIASIEKAAPFPPMPQGLSDSAMVITVPFRYRVQ